MSRYLITHSSFAPSVAEMSYDDFMDRFLPAFPGGEEELKKAAIDLGIEPVAIVLDKPKEGGRKSPSSKKQKNDADISGPKADKDDGRAGIGQGFNEGDKEGLRGVATRAIESRKEEDGRED